MTIWIGADWDTEKCVIAYEVDGKLCRGKVKREPKEVERFMKKLPEDELVVGIEAGDRLWSRLWKLAGATVHVFDGKKARRFGESLCSSGARDDKRSAEDLRIMVQSPGHRADENQERSGEARGLEQIAQAFDEASQDVQQTGMRLGSHLRQVHPALWKIVGSTQALWLLTTLKAAPTPAAWVELDSETQDEVLKGSPRKKRDDIKQALGSDWHGVDLEEEHGVRHHVRLMVRAHREALERKKIAKKVLHEASETNAAASIAKKTDGVGPSIAVNLAIALGDPDAIEKDRDRVALQLGAVPVTTRSGKLGDSHPNVHMRRSASKRLRKIGYLLGFQLVGNYRWAKAQFSYYSGQGKRAATAFRSIVRSFSRILHALIRDNAAFDEDRYIAALKVKGVSWALEL